MYMFMSKNKNYICAESAGLQPRDLPILQNLTHGKAVCDWNAAGPKDHEISLKKLS